MRAHSRRDFLRALAATGAAAFAGALLPRWARSAATPAEASFIVRSDFPPQFETPLEVLGRDWITPNDDFFVRCHLPVPSLSPSSYRLEISGLVRKPLSLGLSELRSLASTEATCVLECAGNGRALYDLPSTSGTQWEFGAVGNAAWQGVSLKTLLKRAGVKPQARHVWFEAADGAPLPKAPPFLRSIPLEKAMKDAFLAHAMNGRPLPQLHGGPLRAVVPGWYGMAWTKWVRRVRVEAKPSDNHFMVKGYRYLYPGEDPVRAKPVEEIQVKSLPTRLERAGPGWTVHGVAWAGPDGVRGVDVSTDGGGTWRPAELTGENTPMAWRQWAASVAADAGTIRVKSRATDGAGRVQPDEARPNSGGYANNSIMSTVFDVR